MAERNGEREGGKRDGKVIGGYRKWERDGRKQKEGKKNYVYIFGSDFRLNSTGVTSETSRGISIKTK